MATQRRTLGVVALLLVVGLSVVACKPKKADNPNTDEDDNTLAEDGADTNAAESDAQLLTSSLLTQSGSGSIGLASATTDLSEGDASSRGIGDGVRALFIPRGCVTPTASEADKTVTYAFKGCNGPYALAEITGEVKVTYRQTDNGLHLDLVATDLAVNKATVDWAATADITATGLSRTMTWKASLTGTTHRGREFARTNEMRTEWTVGEPCFALGGSATGNVNKREVRTEVSNFRRCRGSCPDAGGKIRVTNVNKNATVTIEFDGSNRAKLTTPKGATVQLPLFCRAN